MAGGTTSQVVLRRVALGAALVALIAFAVAGGEYGTFDLMDRTQRRAELESRVALLQGVVDSLEAELELVRTDPVTLERIAREEYGMVKGDRELLYRFAEDEPEAADSSAF